MNRPVPPRVREAIEMMAKGFAPIVGLPWPVVMQHLLDHPDRDQLLAEAIQIHMHDQQSAQRH